MQINGGGCLAPPTPGVRSSNMLGETLNKFTGPDKRTNYEVYASQLPKSLAWRSSTGIGNVVGMGAYIDPTKMTVPENPSDMGMVMRNGKRERVNRPRNDGERLVWQTTQQRSSQAVEEAAFGKPETETIH